MLSNILLTIILDNISLHLAKLDYSFGLVISIICSLKCLSEKDLNDSILKVNDDFTTFITTVYCVLELVIPLL
ncbi:DEHA2G02574p [Debaryomyces hansenii CBS767]|uniref:DEHA2G02574p n=1 Tax=Debaryomyces hansenii (strain ATCC 36239 / CBS 767 / BCRC 21394 / JCM 1990 / NBRC 0083 / IGC 2968) TaxID=284592 RepID=B5RV23_DEBHA|nr:DEHA2G02574p [Debaryomyces hansenii CBS767]CAR65902.1 DEHA2G02574p [Debaryomyces hansenii CBS767]|eukprot:XP_002770567.1 DEHA2G02574p [Debaryomyces hansenii CBS767]